MTPDLFSSISSSCEDFVKIDLGDAELKYYPNFLPARDTGSLFEKLRQTIAWRQEYINMYGSRRPIPRLSAWYGDPNIAYAYSGIAGGAQTWTEQLEYLKLAIKSRIGFDFNGVLVNLYRSGLDSVAWHADDELSLGSDPVVASLSLGASRRFQLKHKREKRELVNLELADGSLLMMMQGTQLNWLHQVPKTRQSIGERINLTFRRVMA